MAENVELERELYHLGRAFRNGDERTIKRIYDICNSGQCISYDEDTTTARAVCVDLNNLGFANNEFTRKFYEITKKYKDKCSINLCLYDVEVPPEHFILSQTSPTVDCQANPINLLFLENKPGDKLLLWAKGEDALEALLELNRYIISWYPNKLIKVLFLDVDGVLNSRRDGYDIDLNTTSHMKLLQKIIQQTGAKIVLSSTWRKEPTVLKEVLIPRLKKFGLEIMDVTPVLNTERGNDIREWIRTCKDGIYRFAILDDNDDMCEFTNTNLIQTNHKVGLRQEDAERCIRLLNS